MGELRVPKENRWDEFGGRERVMAAFAANGGNIAATWRALGVAGPTDEKRHTRWLKDDAELVKFVQACRERKRVERGGARQQSRIVTVKEDEPERLRVIDRDRREEFIANHIDLYRTLLIECMGSLERVANELSKRMRIEDYGPDRVLADIASSEELQEAREEGYKRSVMYAEHVVHAAGRGETINGKPVSTQMLTAAKLVLTTQGDWSPHSKVDHSMKWESGGVADAEEVAKVSPPAFMVVGSPNSTEDEEND